MDRDVREVLLRLIRRRDPPPAVLLEVERLGDVGVDAICELLAEGDLSARQQYRALEGLTYAAKHASAREHRVVLERALERIGVDDIALRSLAARVAIGRLTSLQRRDPDLGTRGHPLRARVATAAREALKLGLHASSEHVVRKFLANEE